MTRALRPLPLLILPACTGNQSMLNPAGHSAARIAELWWFMFAVGMAVWTIVIILAVYTLFVRKRPASDQPIAQRVQGDAERIRWVMGGVGATLVILLTVFVYSLVVSRSIHALVSPEAITIEVVGHQWWWQVIYHDGDQERAFQTANEIRIPVGEPIRLLLRSQDVVHSLWIPNLAGKIDLVPGRTNTLWLRADEPGTYRGQCAQFCGMQHTKMALMVVAHEPEEFAAWAAGQRQPAAAPVASVELNGQRVFMERGCAICHAIRGTEARATVAPDLTHLGSRLTLAAGTLPNNRGHLGGWIANPQVLKPGNHMPRVPLDAEELQALIAYLTSLR